MPDRVILCGPYSVGKTTVGKRLADDLGWEFIDTDSYLGEPVREAHMRLGEATFRKREEEILLPLLDRRQVVIATGGGSLLSQTVYNQLQSVRLVIHLTLERETLWQRWQSRGLPVVAPSRAAFERYLEERLPLYEEVADAVVSANDWETLRGLCGK